MSSKSDYGDVKKKEEKIEIHEGIVEVFKAMFVVCRLILFFLVRKKIVEKVLIKLKSKREHHS